MKFLSVSQIKRDSKTTFAPYPVEGSRTREICEMFRNSPGIPIRWSKTNDDAPRLESLIDRYGLDIRRLGPEMWVLAGEWFGSEYRDYIAEYIARMDERG